MDWSRVNYLWTIVLFLIDCLDSHSDGTHSLQRSQFSTNFHFWVDFSLTGHRIDFILCSKE